MYLNQACQDTLRRTIWQVRPAHHRAGSGCACFCRPATTSESAASMVNTLVKKHLSQAGLDSTQYSSHKLRHTAATLMLQNGVDVKAVQEVLGHEHLNTTEIYTHIDNEALRVAAKANPLSQVKIQREN
ncbi:MAG: tyrosine-type recombinase/integrase [Oscillospiraceae bacterium]